jgi:GrpB-like predicted nucleotidyltransferase (UPF0157 family)
VIRITLSDPDPSWPLVFDAEAVKIRTALGNRARLLEHVGSTAVPGLAAKPVVDIVLTVDDITDEESYLPPLEAIGYRIHLREPDWHQHRLLKRDSPTVNLHVFPVDSPEVGRMVAFRDRLRSDPAARSRYQELKRDLSDREWDTVQAYADAKSPFIEGILAP